MSDGKDRGGGGEGLPAAIADRERIVHVDGGAGVVVVRKWSAVKLLSILRDLFGSITRLPPEFAEAVRKKDSGGAAAWLWENLQEKVLGLVELSVRPEDAGRVRDLAAEDFLAVLDATLDLNLTEQFLGKARALVDRLTTAFKPPTTPSQPLSA